MKNIELYPRNFKEYWHPCDQWYWIVCFPRGDGKYFPGEFQSDRAFVTDVEAFKDGIRWLSENQDLVLERLEENVIPSS